MILSELLSELRENILHDRSDRVAGDEDQLWSDATLIRYINEAQRRFARKALILRDGATPEVTQITLVSGAQQYTLHESVLAVMSAKLVGDTADLARAGHSSFDTYRTPDSYYFDPSSLSSLAPGKPVAYDTDEMMGEDDQGALGAASFRVYPASTADYAGQIIQLRVVRLPINPFTSKNLKAEPELPEDHHLEMLDWAAYLALRIVDVDAGMPDRAKEFRDSFEDHVKTARASMMKKTFTPLQWSFGRNGFSYER